MTVAMTRLLGTVSTSGTADRCVLIRDPRPGSVLEVEPGSHLGVRFRRNLGASRWQVAELPGHLVPLTADGHEFQFLVFTGDDGAVPLRLERRHPERDIVHEVCELLVISVSADDARTSRSA